MQCWLSEKCKSKLQWGITSHQSEWPPSKCLQIINAREGGEKRKHSYTVQFSSVQSLSRVRHFATPWIAACQASLSITNSRSSLNSCPSSRWCHPAISSTVIPFFSCPQSLPATESFPMGQLFAWGMAKYWSFSFSISPFREHPRLISFRMDCLDLLAVQGTLKSLLQHHSSKHQFFSTQFSWQSKSHIHTWPQEKP